MSGDGGRSAADGAIGDVNKPSSISQVIRHWSSAGCVAPPSAAAGR